jgi:WD40 repeat protein
VSDAAARIHRRHFRDRRRVVTSARLWDADTGKLLLTLAGHTGDVLTASFSLDSTLIRTAGLVGNSDEGIKSIRIMNYDTRPAPTPNK